MLELRLLMLQTQQGAPNSGSIQLFGFLMPCCAQQPALFEVKGSEIRAERSVRKTVV